MLQSHLCYRRDELISKEKKVMTRGYDHENTMFNQSVNQSINQSIDRSNLGFVNHLLWVGLHKQPILKAQLNCSPLILVFLRWDGSFQTHWRTEIPVIWQKQHIYSQDTPTCQRRKQQQTKKAHMPKQCHPFTNATWCWKEGRLDHASLVTIK